MSKPVIQARDLSKVYRLYAKPAYRFLDMFGLLRKQDAYTEHKALDRVTLEIQAGEKVAIIGRNGAGKSTLLKVIMGVTEPTSGTVKVGSRVHALLQIGTGFHPEFTGRENVYSYLAQLGVSGDKAEALFAQIVEFSELEEYIEQPIKTYSTGMGMRLMFATSTAIEPELLVLDEVLGVGDAYFSQKSFQRIQELCESHDTTLLLVTHDLYSAAEICDRFIWIERGSVYLDADASTVLKRYESSIRDQQESRLRKLRLQSLEENLCQRGKDTERIVPLFGQIRCQGNVPIAGELPISGMRFYDREKLLCMLEVSGAGPDGAARLLLDAGEGNWGEVYEIDGRTARNFQSHGSIYHRVPFVLESDVLHQLLEQSTIEAEIDFKDSSSTPCMVEVFSNQDNRRFRAALGNTGTGQWSTARVSLLPGTEIDVATGAINRYGNQHFSITQVEFLNSKGEPAHVFNVGDMLQVRLQYRIQDPEFNERPVILLAFMKDGVTRTHRFVADNMHFDYTRKREGELLIVADPILFAPGEYLVNVGVMKEGGFGSIRGKKYFTANEDMLDFHSRAYQLLISPTKHMLGNDVVFYHKAKWIRDNVEVHDGYYPEIEQ